MRPVLLALASVLPLASQAQRLDAFAYVLPPGPWTTRTGAGQVAYTREARQGFCRITLFGTRAGQGSPGRDAAADWEEVMRARHPGAVKGTVRTAPVAGGSWTFTQQIASGRLDGAEALLSVHTFSGHGQRISVLFESTHSGLDDLLNQFINGSRLLEPARGPAQAAAGQPVGLLGKWRRTTASYSHWGLNFSLGELSKLGSQGYSEALYEFLPGEGYSYVRKVWPMAGDRIFYFRESGSYRLEGDGLLLMPRQSATEAWSKRSDDKDLPDRRLAVEAHPLAATRYRTAWHYWSGQKEWNLVLLADQETARDGAFAGNGPHPRGWYFKPADPGFEVR